MWRWSQKAGLIRVKRPFLKLRVLRVVLVVLAYPNAYHLSLLAVFSTLAVYF